MRAILLSLIPMLLCAGHVAHAQGVVTIGSQRLHLDFGESFPSSERSKMRDWLEGVGEAMTTVYGSLPLDDTYVRIKARPSSDAAVPWAHVQRGRHTGIDFYVNPALPLAEFAGDWTAYHEFSHLLIPYPGDDDLWFSEGLASYYQNVVRARSGRISSQQAWQKLYDGFQRGAADDRMSHMSLAELSPRMHETRSFMRVYWSGAYYFLAVDLALRKRGQSLDEALAQLRSCCLVGPGRWSASQLAQRLDTLSGGEEFRREYSHVILQDRMPAFDALFDRHGLVVSNGVIDDSRATPAARAIMQPVDSFE